MRRTRRPTGDRVLEITGSVLLALASALAVFGAAASLHEYTRELEQQETVAAQVVRVQTAGPAATQPQEVAEPEPEPYTPDPYEVELIGRTIWGEAGGIPSAAERAAVAWCILNRVDSSGQTIEAVVTAPHQFVGYRPAAEWGDCPQEHIDLAADVLTRWNAEKAGQADVGRTLPAEYLFFLGDGKHNHFTVEWKGTDTWDWSLPDPYQ